MKYANGIPLSLKPKLRTGIQVVEPSGAIAEFLGRDAQPVQQGEEEVGHRRSLGILNVSSGLEAVIAAPQDDHRQIFVAVQIAVAEAAAIDDHAMIEQRAVAFSNRFQLPDEVGELFDVVAVDPGDLLDQVGKVAVM